MAGLNALTVRDLVALSIVVSRSMVVRSEDLNPLAMVKIAYEIADEFVEKSEGRWATDARVNHQEKKSSKKKNNGGGAVGK